MKKILYILPLIAFSFQVGADADVFKSGVRVGIEGGYKRHKATHFLDFTPNPAFALGTVSETSSKRATLNTGVIGFHLAYDWFFNQFYAALEAVYRHAPGTVDNRIKFHNGPNPGVLMEDFKISQKHKHDIGFNLHLGHTITDCFLLYGIVGLRVGFFEEELTIDSSTATGLVRNRERERATKIGAAFGLGGRYGFADGWSASAEATYDIYGKIKSSKNLFNAAILPAAQGTTLVQSSEKPRMFNLVLKVSKTL